MREEVRGKTHRVYKPKNDNEFLEQLSFITFVIGFNYKVVQQRWPKMKQAFYDFNIETVASLKEEDIDKLLKADGMIRNQRKIRTVLSNAQHCQMLKKDHGTVLKWIGKVKRAHNQDPLLNPSLQEVFQDFNGIGKTTSVWLDNIHNAKGSYVEWEEE